MNIRPVSDLRNNFTEISKIAHETDEPIFLTKNGHGDMVVMSIETYEKIKNTGKVPVENKKTYNSFSELLDEVKANG